MEDKNITFSMNGGQLNYARDNGTIYATQNNGDNTNSLDIILKEIIENLSGIEKEEADKIRDVVDMAKGELVKPEPKVSRLRNCVTLIAPMLTIANGIPALANSLQKLVDYIKPFIR